MPENSTDVVIYDALTRMDDADIYTNTVDLPFRFYPCLAAGLAYYLAMKRALTGFKCSKRYTKKSSIGLQQRIGTGLLLMLFPSLSITGQDNGKVRFR